MNNGKEIFHIKKSITIYDRRLPIVDHRLRLAGGSQLKIETKQFGSIDIDSDKVYTMLDGMPGFSGMKRFVIIERVDIRPFHCFQSIDDPQLVFYIMNPYLFKSDYTVDMEQVAKEAGWEGDPVSDVKLYVIVNTSTGVPERITANLIGPLLIHIKRFEAIQLVLHNSLYSHQHRIFSSDCC